ncbi:MAG: hypothetical protein AAF962_25545 [Actinomycetota bacterium]
MSVDRAGGSVGPLGRRPLGALLSVSLVPRALLLALVSALALAGCGLVGGDDTDRAADGTASTSTDEVDSTTTDGDGLDPAGPDTEDTDGAGTTTGDGADDEADNDTDADADDGPTAPDLSLGDVVPSPLGEYLGDPTYGAEWLPAAAERRREVELERQRFIESCMAAGGFEYLPIEPDPDPAQVTGGWSLADQQTRDWVATYGFGISTTRFTTGELEGRVGLVGFDGAGQERPSDPNLAITGELSPVELEAYFDLLYGATDAAGGGVGGGVGGFEVAGCLGGAAEASAVASFAFYDEFGDELDELYAAVTADERLTDTEAEVADCVADEGLDYLSAEERTRAFAARLRAVDDEVSHPIDELSERDLALLSASAVDELLALPRTVSPAGLAVLAEVQTDEVALALATFDCGGGSLAEAVLRSEVTAEYEEAFIADNGERLAPFALS